jgi:nitrite reductase/ring-hydroxylating ferredoxin subunit
MRNMKDCDEECLSRRGFLKSAGCLGLAAALPISWIDGEQANNGERRYPIPAGDSVNIDRSASIIVVRDSGHVYVFALSCPHENNAVKWVAKDHRFQCTKHDSRYQADGVHTSGRATRNMDRYVIRRDGDAIAVDLHHWIQSDKDPAGWAAAAIAV